MNQFLQYFGLVCLILIVGLIFLRLIFGKKWQRKVAWVILVGPRLMGASKKLADELPNKVRKETLAEVATYAFMRLTRIGLVGLAIALIPIALLWIQNNKITEQNYLIESQRRSSLVLLMNNVLTDLSAEIEKQREGLDSFSLSKQDSIGYKLSQPLIGRIASLSQGLLPYRFLVNGKLTEKEYSIERGQLLSALAKSGLDDESLLGICESARFAAAYLKDANLKGADLEMVKLHNADLRSVDLSESNLSGAEFYGADLFLANLTKANLFAADFSRANLNMVWFDEANLNQADFARINLVASFVGADLIEASFRDADLSQSDLYGANLSGADLWGANLSGTNLNEASSLFEVRGLDQKLQQELEKERPCLFTKEGCE